MMTKSTWGTGKPAISSLRRRRTCTALYAGPRAPRTHAHTQPHRYAHDREREHARVGRVGRRAVVVVAVSRAFQRATSHGCMGPICIWTRARGDASSIISLGITPSTRGTQPSRVASEYSARGFNSSLFERERKTRDVG